MVVDEWSYREPSPRQEALIQASLLGCSFWLQKVPWPWVCHSKHRRRFLWMLSGVQVTSFQSQNHSPRVAVNSGGVSVTREGPRRLSSDRDWEVWIWDASLWISLTLVLSWLICLVGQATLWKEKTHSWWFCETGAGVRFIKACSHRGADVTFLLKLVMLRMWSTWSLSAEKYSPRLCGKYEDDCKLSSFLTR